ncbi:HNH endonuclease domain-containing protein [Deinococcus radiophilus]|uniref:HNH nuclease domain-containing protein n=1 Tax=Deinococcus radiophilus TaxID=32062 RepID=A0A431VTD3_9DEIO|nr:HNH endonuclease domain-containing protein [Deinococcus radiophilus]RTR26373.1 hypothetical protein EJ104_08530 [Deinococcus radiophilus]UFA51978.1 hypothetical protein LMT64_13885 [Deinococcus radiophilus]
MDGAAVKIIQRVLKHDRKTNNYKIALLRALNDLALNYAGVSGQDAGIAVSLKLIAELWIGYYWPFMNQEIPVYQGGFREGTADVVFRRELTQLKALWQASDLGSARPSDGIVLVSEAVNGQLSPELQASYARCVKLMIKAIQQPIRYAGDGPSNHGVFSKPRKLAELPSTVVTLPQTDLSDLVTVISDEMWESFKFYSLYVEALCLHEWAMFVEANDRTGSGMDRGQVYLALTDRPDSRRPLNWERNQFELMMMEGKDLRCFWTDVPLNPRNYDVDHIVPITTYPINELWNLVPSESEFNRHLKRNRMPDLSWEPVMRQRLPHIYELYSANPHLHQTLIRGVRHRFPQAIENAQDLSEVAIELIFAVAESRNTPTFSTTL